MIKNDKKIDKVKKIITYLVLFLAFTRCEEVIELELPNNDPKLVVDGLITNKPEPYTITVSKTKKYNYKYDVSDIEYVYNSIVIVLDDEGNIDTLEEQSPGKYVTDPNIIIGKVGRTYQVEILTPEGEQWISEPEKMLPVPEIDSIYFDRDIADRMEGNPNYYKFMIYVDWYDPIDEENYYLRNISYNWSNKWHELLSWNWILDDKYINGTKVDRYLIQEDYGGAPFKVKVSQYSLTADAYKFWRLVHEQTLLSDDWITTSAVPLYGNVYNKKNPSNYSLGYFQVSAVTESIVDVDR